MTARLDGTVAIVTGASSGIGEATALALAAEGATVALFARRRDRLDATVEKIVADGGTAAAYEVDVTDAASVATGVQDVVAQHGRVDVLVNNAGWASMTPAREADLADWDRMIDVNIRGVLATTHAALPHLVDAATGPRGTADVVTISSIAGRRVPSPQSNVYAATKFAVGAFAEALRQELVDQHVRSGLVEPGVVRTEMTTGGGKGAPDATSGNPLHPQDIADAIVYMVTRPAHAAVNEILIRPAEQSR